MEIKMEILLTETLQVTKTEMEQEQAEIQLVLEMETIKSLEVHGEVDVMKVLIFQFHTEKHWKCHKAVNV